MLATHPTLQGEEFLHKLALVGVMLWKDISVVEAKHASIRRLLKVASLQTHHQSFSDLSAQWCFVQHRKRAEKFRSRGHGSAEKKQVLVICKEHSM